MTTEEDRLLWDDVVGELDAPEREQLLRALRASPALESERSVRENLTNDLRLALRTDEPEPLSEEQRAHVHQTVEGLGRLQASKRAWVASCAACAALLLLSTTVYLGVIQPERVRVAEQRAAAERISAERLSEIRRLEAESALLLQAAEKARLSAILELQHFEARAQTQANRDLSEASSAERKRRPTGPKGDARSANGKAASGACDPNDPLCGL